MKNKKTVDEITKNASELPAECQEKILDILKGMAFTKKCLTKETIENRKEIQDGDLCCMQRS